MAAVDADVAVVGAGPAGAAAALFAAQSGRRVVVFDRATFPRDKACGEGLMPPGGKIRLSEYQVATIRAWIETGAPAAPEEHRRSARSLPRFASLWQQAARSASRSRAFSSCS